MADQQNPFAAELEMAHSAGLGVCDDDSAYAPKLDFSKDPDFTDMVSCNKSSRGSMVPSAHTLYLRQSCFAAIDSSPSYATPYV